MKIGKVVRKPIGREKFASQVINPNKDFYFFPFYPAFGFSRREDNINVSEVLFDSIINGKKSIILKWLGAEQSVTWEDPQNITKESNFKRNVGVGEYFQGYVTSANYAVAFDDRDSGMTTIQGDPINYKEQVMNKRITVHVETDFFSDAQKGLPVSNLQRLFFICPELAGNDVLYIESIIPFFNEEREVIHQEITFTSLGDKLRTVGATLEGFVRFSEPGAGYAFPYVAEKQKVNKTPFLVDTVTKLQLTRDEAFAKLTSFFLDMPRFYDAEESGSKENVVTIGRADHDSQDTIWFSKIHARTIEIMGGRGGSLRRYTLNEGVTDFPAEEVNILADVVYSHYNVPESQIKPVYTEEEITLTDPEFIPNTKKVYVDRVKWQDRAVHGMSISFDGAVALSGIQVFGRPKIADDRDNPNDRKIGRYQPLFLYTDTVNSKVERDRYSVAEVNQYQLIHGAPYNQQWFTEWKEEYGYFFDPLKRRASDSTLKCLYDDDESSFTGAKFNKGEKKIDTTKYGKIYGRHNLAYNKWSQYKLVPTKSKSTNNITLAGEDFKQNIDSIDTFLNTNSIWQWGNSYLEQGGFKTKNQKGFIQSIVGSALSVGGIVAGVGASAVTGGTGGLIVAGISSQAGSVVDKVFSWIPDRWFTSTEEYRPPTMSSFLVPSNLVEDFAYKVGDHWEEDTNSAIKAFTTNKSKNIPSEFFADATDNFMSGLVNSKSYKCNFEFKLTNKFQTHNGTQLSDVYESKIMMDGDYGAKGTSKFYTDEAIHAVDPATFDNTGYIVDAVVIRALTKVPFKLSFYDVDGNIIWTETRLTQGGYTGNVYEWETSMLFSDVQDDQGLFNNENYVYAPFAEKDIENIIITNITTKEKKAEAKKRLDSYNTIDLVLGSNRNLESWDYTFTEPDRWENSRHYLFGGSGNLAVPASHIYVELTLPSHINQDLNDYYYNDLSSINTLRKKIEKLKTDFGFKKVQTFDSFYHSLSFDFKGYTSCGGGAPARGEASHERTFEEPNSGTGVILPFPELSSSESTLAWEERLAPFGTEKQSDRSFSYDVRVLRLSFLLCGDSVEPTTLYWTFPSRNNFQFRTTLYWTSNALRIRTTTEFYNIHYLNQTWKVYYHKTKKIGLRNQLDSARIIK